MKLILKIILIGSLFLGSCSSMKTSYVYDDLYNSPNDEVVVSNNNVNAALNSEVASDQSIEQKINNILKDTTVQDVDSLVYEDEYVNPYDKVLVDDYESAYEKRRNALQDPYYGLNNLSVLYSDDYWYASAYDPYYYNMIIMGSQVWVEPRYISSSFGFSYGYRYNSYPYYGYGWPSSYFGYSPYSYFGYSPYSSYYGYPYNYWGYDNYYTNNYFRNNPTSINRRRGIGGFSNYNAYSRTLPEVHTATAGRKSSTIKDGLDNNTINNHTVRRGVVSNSDTKKNDIVRRNNLSNTQIAKENAVRRRTSNYTRPAGSSSIYNTTRRTRTNNYNNANSNANKNASTTNNRYSRPRRSVSTNSNNSNTRSTYNRGSSSKSNYSKSNTSNNSRRSNSNRSSSSYSGSSNSGSSSSKSSSSSSSSSSSTTRRSGRR